MITEMNAMRKALQTSEAPVQVSKELYWHFLEVLPPRDMGANFFVFQEGDADRMRFTQLGDKYYCQLEADILVTDDWGLWVSIRRQCPSGHFKVDHLWSGDEQIGEDLEDQYSEFVGKEFPTVAALSDSMGVTFRL